MKPEVIDGGYKVNPEYSNLGLDRAIMHALLESDLPPKEKCYSRLWQEGQITDGAGADTTSNALTVIHFHLLDNPDILQKLRSELEDSIPDKSQPVDLGIAEKLPYLVS